MIVGIQGSKTYNDYSSFIHGMAMPLRLMSITDKKLTVFSAGPKRINEMALEFLNVSDFKSRGISIKLIYMPESWFRNNFEKIEMFIYFCSKLVVCLSLLNGRLDILFQLVKDGCSHFLELVCSGLIPLFALDFAAVFGWH